MKTQLQHFFNPLHLWCLFGGQCIRCFRLYEKWLWRPLLRPLLTARVKERKRGFAIPLVPSLGYEARRDRRRPE
jgi:hypothetical protein